MSGKGFAIVIKHDYAGAMMKTATLKLIPSAMKRNASMWASDTVKYIKDANKGGGGNFMSFKRAPKEIDQSLTHKVTMLGADEVLIAIGTGSVVSAKPVVYARIQDEGGEIVPKAKKFLTIPLPGVKGWIREYPGGRFIPLKSGLGYLYVAGATGKRKGKALFVLKKRVVLPARRWFTGRINQRRPELDRTMSEESVWATANAMAEGYKAGTGG